MTITRCPIIIPLLSLREHSSQCHPPYASSSSQPTQLTPSKINAILQRPLDHPLSREETKAMSHLVRASIQQIDGKQAHLECPTGGQVSMKYIACITALPALIMPRPRKSSLESAVIIVRDRSSRLAHLHKSLSGRERSKKAVSG